MTEQPASAVMELLREAATAAAGAVVDELGSGDMNRLDGLAVAAVRAVLGDADIDVEVAVGEGAKDRAPMLRPGERLGNGQGPAIDLAVDPLDGTRAAASGRDGAMVAIASAPRASMIRAPNLHYVEKLVVGPDGVDRHGAPPLRLDDPWADTLGRVADRLGTPLRELRVGALDRPRNAEVLEAIADLGARWVPLQADLPASVAVAEPRGEAGVDVVAGIGGFPEAVVAACALGCLGGELLCRPWTRSEDEAQSFRDRGLARTMSIRDLVGEDGLCFAAAGVTQTELLAAASRDSGGVVQVETLAFDDRHRAWAPRAMRHPA